MKTLKEVVEEFNPECVASEYEGGVVGCPPGYKYLNVDCVHDCKDITCKECWSRPYKEEQED